MKRNELGAVETNVVVLVAAILFCICAVVWLVQAF